MLETKRGADNLTRFSNKNKRTCSGGESLISDLPVDSQGTWSQLSEEVASNLSRSVVLILLTNGDKVRSTFCGIAIECQNNVTRFVTSGSLVRALELECHVEKKIKVRCDGNDAVGHLEEYDSDYQLAVVKVMSPLDVYCIHLNHEMEFIPHKNKKVVAVGRDAFGKLKATSGIVSYGSGDREFLIFSVTDDFPKNCKGVAFFDFDGNFVGMNNDVLLPSRIFLEKSTSTQRRAFHYVGMNGWYETICGEHYFHPKAYDDVDTERFQILYHLGYPIPSRSMINRGMVLFNIFEEPFGDIYPKGVWGRFRKSVSSKISRSVVALSSFIGETRFFACTGVFIDFDDTCLNILTSASLVRTCIGKSKIVGNLKIEVLLPNNRCEVGTLKHYSLHYNVALVSVKKCCASPPAVDLKHRSPMDLKCERINTKVVAVGRFVQSGTLMAANGKLIIGSGKLDCRILSYSTCKITKAGIGGPLVDLDGNFVGMNFHGLNYHCKRIGTPFLNREGLCGILEYFKTKNTKYPKIGGSKGVIVEDVGQINKWPVPYSCWRDPSDLKKDRASYKHAVSTGGCPVRYSRGSKLVLK